ncbi:DUF58 domain-containing protein [Nanoarchaeota archaeon]
MIELEFLRQLDSFQLAMKRKVHSQYQGARETKQFGSGLVFKDYREYVPGDDTRFVDWKVYGRTNKLFIKRFEEERNMVVHIIVDASASMNYGSHNITKFDYANMIGIGFAYMALRNNEKFNFITFAEKLDLLRPRKGMDQLMSIVDHLNKRKANGKSKFRQSMEAYKKAIRSKSLIVIISDFLYDVDEFKEVVNRYKRSDVMVIQVLDPAEKELNLEGDVILKDSELDTRLRTFISRRTVKKYSDKLEDHTAKLSNACEQVDAAFISVTTDTPIFDVFYNVLNT